MNLKNLPDFYIYKILKLISFQYSSKLFPIAIILSSSITLLPRKYHRPPLYVSPTCSRPRRTIQVASSVWTLSTPDLSI